MNSFDCGRFRPYRSNKPPIFHYAEINLLQNFSKTVSGMWKGTPRKILHTYITLHYITPRTTSGNCYKETCHFIWNIFLRIWVAYLIKYTKEIAYASDDCNISAVESFCRQWHLCHYKDLYSWLSDRNIIYGSAQAACQLLTGSDNNRFTERTGAAMRLQTYTRVVFISNVNQVISYLKIFLHFLSLS
jgi:hypothetical protein